MMFGKSYKSKYRGSMYGGGIELFAVWDYVTTNMERDKEMGAQVELNSVEMSNIFGNVTPEKVQEVIDKLCAPDPKSRTKLKEGRRLIRLGEYDYQVVNGEYYLGLRDAEEKRARNRERQARFQAKKDYPTVVVNKPREMTVQEQAEKNGETAKCYICGKEDEEYKLGVDCAGRRLHHECLK